MLRLTETTVGKWLELGRVQSAPVSVVPMLLGYATVKGTVATREAFYLAIIVALGHWSVYSMNDIMDHEEDRAQGKHDKPLVGDGPSLLLASIVSFTVLIASYVMHLMVAGGTSSLAYFLAIFMGVLYNWRSKKGAFSFIYLSIWGGFIVASGVYAGGAYNIYSAMLITLFSVHMFWMVQLGDLKDIGMGERNIAEDVGVEILNLDNIGLKTPNTYVFVCGVAIFSQGLIMSLMWLVSVSKFSNIALFMGLMVTISGIAVLSHNFASILNMYPYNRERVKEYITIHEAVTVLLVAYVSITFMETSSVILIGAGTVIWGVGWQYILFGEALHFT